MTDYRLLAAALGVVLIILVGAFAFEYGAYTSEVSMLREAKASITSLQAEVKSLMGPPQVTQSATNYCTLSTTCNSALSGPIHRGNLIVASGGCPGPFARFTDSFGNNFTVDVRASVRNVSAVTEEIATAHATNQNASLAMDVVTMICGSGGTIGLQVLTITGIQAPFTVASVTGGCTSHCTNQLSTVPAYFNGSRAYIAVGSVYAYPGCSCSQGGPGFSLVISHDNRLLATEFSMSLPSPTTFPLTDGAQPDRWLDVGAVFVSSA
jgi:hypothetical protein